MPRNRSKGRRGIVSPISKNATFERVDQGVDWSQQEPYVAVANGTVSAITRGWHGGTGIGVYITLDKPITINGRTYDQVYYAELQPLVKVGQKVHAGQAVVAGGAGELGFAHDNGPVAPLAGGFGSGTQSSVAGHDFLDLASGDKHVQVGQAAPLEHATASFHEARAERVPRQEGGGIGFPDLPPAMGGQPFGPQQSSMQQGASGLMPFEVNNIWQSLSESANASPETRQFASNASLINQNVPDVLLPQGSV